MREPRPDIPDLAHDHDDCVDRAMAAAEEVCRERGLRFTSLRRRVLGLVWESHKPAGAYEILERLGKEGQSAAPPTVYRALEFLIEAGLVHRLDSLNAYIGCPDPSDSHAGQFLICRECRSVVELDDSEIDELVKAKVKGLGFTPENQVLEIQGLCVACRADS
jgi:Fur family zinc uptake transcriptional regulator